MKRYIKNYRKKIEVAKHNKSQGSDNICDRPFVVDIQTMDKINPSISLSHFIISYFICHLEENLVLVVPKTYSIICKYYY